jgi:Na+-driven multidrug efflux pump
MPMMTHRHGACIGDEVDLHLGQKPKLGGRYADDSLIYISYFVGTLYIHGSFSFLFFVVLVLISTFQNTKDQKYFRCFSLFAFLVF